MYKKIILLLFIFFSFCSLNTWAWNDERTHYDLSIKASEHSIISLTGGDYLKNLGFSKNVEEKFTLNGETKLVKEWIGEGAIEEDAGSVFTAYYYNHFHNPRFSWDQAGLKTYYPWINGESSIIWAQDDTQDTTPPNPWRWQKAREYYYLALTSQTDTQRQENFANTFKGVGHIIHLIQDAAQPAHVRNDPHPLDDWGIVPQFENWAKDPENLTIVSSFISNPVFPAISLNTPVSGYAPITQLWDINKYDGTNPTDAVGNTIGISEYTNANFFSEDTIFTEPYPARSSVVEYDETIDNNTGELRTYLKKTGDGETIQHLAVGKWFYKYLPAQYKHLGLKLDDNVYSDYASLLLPRAVGYSASLINYFFRGQINMEKEPNNTSLYIIKNESDEYMSGTFTLYYDDANDNRRYLTSWNKSINPKSPSDSVSIAEPTDMKEKGKYILVFQGTMGNEAGTVVGRVVIVKGNPEGRVLYLTSNNSIAVADSKGTLTFYLPNVINSDETVVAARFDRSDWNVFVIATSKGPSNPPPSQIGCTGCLWNWHTEPTHSERSNYLHKFQIDEYFRINYLGAIYSDTYANYEMSDSALSYTEQFPDGSSAFHRTEGFAIYYPDNTNSSVPFKPASGWNWAGKIKTKTIKDIYVDGNIVKPLIEIREAEASNSVTPATYKKWYSNINCSRKFTITYGESPVNEKVETVQKTLLTSSCLSGCYPAAPYLETLSSGETSTGEVWNPLLIANQDNIFYTKKEPPDTNTFKLYRSPNILLLPSHFYSSDIFSYIRKDAGGYSLAFNKSAYGELYTSISSEGGALSDVMFIGNKDLIGFNIKYTGNWTDWSRSPYRIFRTHSIYLSKANIDPALPNGYEIKDISPILASWWDTRRAFKKFDFILKGD